MGLLTYPYRFYLLISYEARPRFKTRWKDLFFSYFDNINTCGLMFCYTRTNHVYEVLKVLKVLKFSLTLTLVPPVHTELVKSINNYTTIIQLTQFSNLFQLKHNADIRK